MSGGNGGLAPLRVLHVVGRMNRGGVETWLMNSFRQQPRDVSFAVMVHRDDPGAYDNDLERLAVPIYPNTDCDNAWAYIRSFARILREAGPFDVVHSHVHHFSGLVLAVAAYHGIPMRIAHSHNDTAIEDATRRVGRRFYLALMRRAINRFSTHGFACSELAAVSLFGDGWRSERRWRLLHCGIDLAPFQADPDPAGVRAEFLLPPESKLLIHVGRFDEQKNHRFLLEVFAEVARLDGSIYLLLVGAGSLEPDIRSRAAAAGIGDRIVFCGTRSDVPRLLAASNVFVFPSTHEGLPLACLEAQAAGIQVVVSDRVTEEVLVDPRLAIRLSLNSPGDWVTQLRERVVVPPRRELALQLLTHSPFDITESARSLFQAYRDWADRRHVKRALVSEGQPEIQRSI